MKSNILVFGSGGGKITRKMFLAILLFLSIALLSLDNVSATPETASTANSSSITNSNNTTNLNTNNSINALSFKSDAVSTTSTSDKTSPTVKNVDPANKTVNVSVSKVIKVTFSESIKKGNYWIELNGGGKTVPFTTSISGNVLTITPTSSLTKGTKYTLILHTGSITDLNGNNVSLTTSTFTTDGIAPTIKTIDPSNKATNVAINKTIKVTFSESIKKGNYWIELNGGGKTVPFTTSISGNILTITPTSNLTKGTKYTLIIHTGSVTDLSGNNVSLYTSTFTTDSTAPTIKTIDPTNKATNVAVNKIIKVTFSETVKAGNYWIELKDSNGKAVAFTKSINGNILTITPTSNLTKGTLYTLIIHTGSLTDLAGNNVSLYTSAFTTNGTLFTRTQIQNASASVKSFIETNSRLPNYVTIGSSQITMSQFLQLLVTGLLQINSGTNTAISIGNVNSPTNSTGDYIYGNINEAEYLNIAQSIKTFINSNNIAPNYATSSLGKIPYETLIYMFSKVVNYYGANSKLPAYVSVDSTVANPGSYSIPPELQQYLQATTNCQVNDASIKSLASTLTSGKSSTYDKAAAIFNWVRDNIGYSFYYNTKYGAVGTLNAKTGNCVDTAHLLIALERAAGIPARYEHVYAQFSSGSWYGHVIAQVWVNGKWYNADATSYSNTFGVIKSWNTATATVYGTYATLPF